MSTKIVFGSDPEVSAGYEKEGKLYVLPPAYFRYYKGVPFEKKKDDPRHPIFLEEDGIKIIEDGVAFEFTVPPSEDWKELFQKIQHAKELLEKNILEKFPEDNTGKTLTLPTMDYEVKRWIAENDEFAECLIFGCDKDYTIHKKFRAGKVMDVARHPKRYFGGHIHISGVPEMKENVFGAVSSLCLINLASVAYSDVPELDRERTFLYGTPGRFRPQEYKDGSFGIEFRSCSNAWTRSENIAREVFKWAEIAVKDFFLTGLWQKFVEKYQDDMIKATIECDQQAALALLKEAESM